MKSAQPQAQWSGSWCHPAFQKDCVHIQLEGGTSLLTLGHVFNQTASDSSVIVGEVHLSRAGTIGKARDEGTERSGLTKRSTDALVSISSRVTSKDPERTFATDWKSVNLIVKSLVPSVPSSVIDSSSCSLAVAAKVAAPVEAV